MARERDLSSYETGDHAEFEKHWSPSRGSVEVVEDSR